MFTGIIQEQGEIKDIQDSKKGKVFSILTNSILEGKKVGDSIAVDGACMTITKIDGKTFDFFAMSETMDITNFAMHKTNDKVNLEPALTLNQALDGHIIQGHIDMTCEVKGFSKNDNSVRLTITFPKDLSDYLAFKGSITINGVSLTITDLKADTFTVDLIPHTLEITNLSDLKKGDKVNIEVDLIARYLKNLLDSKEKETKYEFLKDRGFI
jgi:riboflavin synthase